VTHKFNLAARPPSAHKGGLQTDETSIINEVRGWRRFLLRLLALLVRGWGRTLRFEVDASTRQLLASADKPVVFVLWHNRLFLTPVIFQRYYKHRRVHGLVSASKDGAWLAAFYRLIGIQPVRGSSSKLGREAARAVIAVLQAGHDVGITPDGPRGPVYTVEPGVLVVTRRQHAPMVLVGAEFGPAWRLRSWDRFYLPWPFTRIRLRMALLRPNGPDGTKLSADDLRTALLAINTD
jgi:lysophospholipid acyltransferase (LPLAT)-like uncharacterized protein